MVVVRRVVLCPIGRHCRRCLWALLFGCRSCVVVGHSSKYLVSGGHRDDGPGDLPEPVRAPGPPSDVVRWFWSAPGLDRQAKRRGRRGSSGGEGGDTFGLFDLETIFWSRKK